MKNQETRLESLNKPEYFTYQTHKWERCQNKLFRGRQLIGQLQLGIVTKHKHKTQTQTQSTKHTNTKHKAHKHNTQHTNKHKHTNTKADTEADN